MKSNNRNKIVKKKVVFFLPNGIMIPEIHVMMSLIQNYINDKKNKVSIISCGGLKDYSCSLNIYGIKEICKVCISRRNNALSKLTGNFNIHEIGENRNFPKKYNYKTILDLKYKKIDFGLGVYSSYTNTTRDSYLKGKQAKTTIKNLLNTSYSIYFFFKKFLKKNNIDELIVYNSRMSEKRPLFRLANQKNIKVSNYEKLSVEKFYNFSKYFSQDRNFLKREIVKFLKKDNGYYVKEKKFFKDKFNSKKDPINFEVYSKYQKKNLLPKGWAKHNNNIVFYTASDDEHLSFGREYNPPFARDQKDLIYQTCLILANKKNFVFWIRCHPRWRRSKWFDRKFFNEIQKKFNNVNVIYPEDNISSYAMLKDAYNVICLWSFLLVESTYWRKKPSISLTKNDFSECGVSVVPKNIKEYSNLILRNFETRKKNQIKALRYAKFFLNAGSKIKFFSGSIETGYTFKNYNLSLSAFEKIIFIIGKIKEKINNYVYN